LTALKELYIVDMDVSNVMEGLISLFQDAKDTDVLPGLTKVCLIRPQTLDVDALLSWSEERMTHDGHIDHKLTIVLDDKMSPSLKIPECLPKNVEIHIPGSTFKDVHDEAFEEPYYMTCPPFGRDLS
jgi:hypothetical protein